MRLSINLNVHNQSKTFIVSEQDILSQNGSPSNLSKVLISILKVPSWQLAKTWMLYVRK